MFTARILVVDDDEVLRQLVGGVLTIADVTVAEAVDGPDGLAQAAARQPDVILLDVMMPGMDGYAVCRALKAEPTTRASHVIVLTASVDPSSNRNVYAAGAAACLTKPLRTEALMAVVRRRGGASGSPAGRRHPGDHAAMAEAGSGPEIGRLAARDGFKVEIPSTRCRPPCVQVGASTRLPRRPDGSPLISVNRTG